MGGAHGAGVDILAGVRLCQRAFGVGCYDVRLWSNHGMGASSKVFPYGSVGL